MNTKKLFPLFLTLNFIMIMTPLLNGQMAWVNSTNNPTELGNIHWLRDYDEAIKKSKAENKPIFIQFQEVPGCMTCTRYGKSVLSHPFLVEAIETYFVPLAIFNNKKGNDKKILDKYNEPSWNNPVSRIVNSDGKNIVPRLAGHYQPKDVLNNIMDAMLLENINIPPYLQLWSQEAQATHRDEAYLSMYCFWTGEKQIAQIPGVLSTQAGFMDGKEVVKVSYDKDKVKLDDMVEYAATKKCANTVYVDNEDRSIIADVKVKKPKEYRADTESKYFITKSTLRAVPMLDIQSAKVNSALGLGLDPLQYLSPRQIQVFELAKARGLNWNFIEMNFEKSWQQLRSKLSNMGV